jgi:hypothetical protein
MAESVFDASFIGYANSSLDDPTPHRREFLRQLLNAITSVISRQSNLRCNQKLLSEYEGHLKVRRNDVIDQFITILDSEETVKLSGSTLRSPHKARANDCRWPSHDQHVLAAAIDGTNVTIHVTERVLGLCAQDIWRKFRIRINYVAYVD